MSSPKESALEFLTLVTSGQVAEAYDRHAAPNFRHHNAYFKSDRASLQKGMEDSDANFPHKQFKVQRAIAEGDLVAVHSHMSLQAGQLELAVVHLFRFENGKIAEFWDVVQQIPEDVANELGMF